jgi:phosphate transport system substrate-binding protein
MKFTPAKYSILFAAAMLLLAATISSFIKQNHKNENKIITITGTRFFFPLVEKWAEEFKKENPGLDIVVKFGLENSDISMTGTPVDKEDPARGTYTVVSKFAIVPIINAKKSCMEGT